MKTKASRLSASVLVGLGPRRGVREAADLLGLVAFEPVDAALEDAGDERHVVAPGDLQAVDDQRGRVGVGVLAEAGEPAPAAVGELHGGQGLAGLPAAIARTSSSSKTGLRGASSASAAAGVADLLRVEVGPLLADRLEVQPHAGGALLA